MEDIYLDSPLDNAGISNSLILLFPSLTFFYWNFVEEEPAGFEINNPLHIVFNTDYSVEKKEFGFKISIWRTPDTNYQERALYIAKHFSDVFRERVLVPFTDPANKQNPYLDILFDKNKIFLVDDSDTSFADNTQNRVKIIKEYAFINYEFDEKGNLHAI